MLLDFIEVAGEWRWGWPWGQVSEIAEPQTEEEVAEVCKIRKIKSSVLHCLSVTNLCYSCMTLSFRIFTHTVMNQLLKILFLFTVIEMYYWHSLNVNLTNEEFKYTITKAKKPRFLLGKILFE